RPIIVVLVSVRYFFGLVGAGLFLLRGRFDFGQLFQLFELVSLHLLGFGVLHGLQAGLALGARLTRNGGRRHGRLGGVAQGLGFTGGIREDIRIGGAFLQRFKDFVAFLFLLFLGGLGGRRLGSLGLRHVGGRRFLQRFEHLRLLFVRLGGRLRWRLALAQRHI